MKPGVFIPQPPIFGSNGLPTRLPTQETPTLFGRVLWYLDWVRFHALEAWRVAISVVLSLLIYILFSWLPNGIAFVVTAVLLCLFGQYDVNIKKRKIK
jgi:uncharacterized membrane protein YccC